MHIKEKTVSIGVDVHKYSHTAVVVDAMRNCLGSQELSNSQEDFMNILKTAKSYEKDGYEVIFGLEDIQGNGKLLSRFLLSSGCTVYNVPGIRVDNRRRRTPHAEKSDFLDAQRVAKVLLDESDNLPQAIISESTESSQKIKRLVTDCRVLKKESTMSKNQLHIYFHEAFGDHYRKKVNRSDIFCKSALVEWEGIISKSNLDSTLKFQLLRRINRLQVIREEIKQISQLPDELAAVDNNMQLLCTIPCMSNYLSGLILSEIHDINRFKSPGSLAKYAGIAPREHSSGCSIRHYTDFRGNRSLNHILHMWCLALVQHSEEADEYYKRKQSEGKSKLHSLRCLKRQLIKIIYAVLRDQKPYLSPTERKNKKT